MGSNTLSGSKPDSIFDIGNIFDRLGQTAIQTFEQIAPIWTAQQLGLQEQNNDKKAITFQETRDRRIRRNKNLSTQNTGKSDGTNQSGFSLSTNQILLLAGGGLLGLILLQNN